jgi:hypothetical protein
MKTINVTFTDEEHDVLVNTKGDLNWHDFILKIKDLEDLFEWAWRFIEKSDSGNAIYFEALEDHGPIDAWNRYYGAETNE